MLGEIRRHFRDATWAVRVPRRLKDLHVELGAANEHLASELGRAPNPDELARYLGIGVEDVLEAMEAGGAYRSSPLELPSDDGERPREVVALRMTDERFENVENRVFIERLLEALPEREREIVRLRFFAELSQAEIASIVGLSQVHVSRLLRSSLALLQEAAGGTAPAALLAV